MRLSSQLSQMEERVFDNTAPEVIKGKVGAYSEYSHFNKTFFSLYNAEKTLAKYLAKTSKNLKVIPPFRFRDGSNLFLGSDISIGPWVFLGDGGRLEIGDNSFIGPRVQVHTIHHSLEPERRSFVHAKDITIGKNVFVGGGAIVLADIGDDAIVVPGSVVTHDVPAGSVVVGNPARIVGEEEAVFYIMKTAGYARTLESAQQEIVAHKRLRQFNQAFDNLYNAEEQLSSILTRGILGKDIKVVPPIYFDARSEIILEDKASIEVGVILYGRGKIKISEGSYVGPYGQMHANLGKNVEIGKNVVIGGGVVILPDVKIGDDAIVFPGSVVTDDVPSNSLAVGNPAKIVEGKEAEFYRKKMANYSNNSSKEEELAAFQAFENFNISFDKLYNAENQLASVLGNHKVGKNIKIVPPVYCLDKDQKIGDGVHLNGGVVLAGKSQIGERVLIGPYTQMQDAVLANDVWIGGGVIILPGVKIGEGAAIGAGSVVVRDIPPNSVAVGNPAKVIRSIE